MIRVEIHETKNRKIEKISETKPLFFGGKNNKIEKSLPRLAKKKKTRQKLMILGMKQKYLISL